MRKWLLSVYRCGLVRLLWPEGRQVCLYTPTNPHLGRGWQKPFAHTGPFSTLSVLHPQAEPPPKDISLPWVLCTWSQPELQLLPSTTPCPCRKWQADDEKLCAAEGLCFIFFIFLQKRSLWASALSSLFSREHEEEDLRRAVALDVWCGPTYAMYCCDIWRLIFGPFLGTVVKIHIGNSCF